MKSLFPFVSSVLLLFASIPCFSQSGQWAWMKGDTNLNSLAVWGIKGVGDPANNPPPKYSYYHWQDSSGNFWIYSGISGFSPYPYTGYNDVWKFDIASENWIWMHGDSTPNSVPVYGVQGVPSPNNTPGFRFFAGLCWTDNNGKFWLYSGSTYTDIPADLWMYDPGINEWTWMQGSQAGTSASYGAYQVSSPTNTPGSISEANDSWVDDDNNLWFYGGQLSLDYGAALWKYDQGTNEWTWMAGSNVTNAPPVFGTLGVPDVANLPGARFCYASWKDGDGNFMMFGGNTPPYAARNDVWKYDLADQTWTWMGGDTIASQQGVAGSACEFSTSFIPDARFENRACVSDSCGNVWMFGGHSTSVGCYSDLWIYRPQTNDWAWVGGVLDSMHHPHYGIMSVPDAQNDPGQRGGSVCWFDHDGNIWLFSGIGGGLFSGYYTQDLWKYIPDAGCVSTACVVTSTNNDADFTEELRVYPNPSSGIINIEIPSAENVKIEIRNAIGQLIFSSEEKNYHYQFNTQIDLSAGLHSENEVTSGIYCITLKTEKEYWVKKVIITR